MSQFSEVGGLMTGQSCLIGTMSMNCESLWLCALAFAFASRKLLPLATPHVLPALSMLEVHPTETAPLMMEEALHEQINFLG
jgi:hypothetical protein